MVVNATLAAAAKHGMSREPAINVYQVSSSVVNPLTWQEMATLSCEHFKCNPILDSKGNPISVAAPMKLYTLMEEFSTHLERDMAQQRELMAMKFLNSKKPEIYAEKWMELIRQLATIYKPYSFYKGRYDVSIDTNTRGTSHLMNFAKYCKNLSLFLQISTAYVNGPRKGIIMEKKFSMGDTITGEKFNSENLSTSLPILNVEKEIQLAFDAIDTFQDNSLTQNLKKLGLERAEKYGWHDTYAFTKAMGEMVIDSMRGEVPVVIIRPSIIESTYKEPFSGWIQGNR
ncbi:conserved hypothetical protein [Ricinus communis]|uniref:Fatty acyl-CoA reductase n=1 Tax=Ricinus communis TaxID=3988 RepID=B9T8W2_RICCO|nr:conserved hypothetical protein [Ricinus communis]